MLSFSFIKKEMQLTFFPNVTSSPVAAAEERARRGLHSAELPRVGSICALCYEGVQVRDVDGLLCLLLWWNKKKKNLLDSEKQNHNQVWAKAIFYLDGLVGSCDEGDEEWQHHIDEEGYEGVQVHLTEQPHQRAALLQPRECHEHVVAVDEGEQTLRHHGQRSELRGNESRFRVCAST